MKRKYLAGMILDQAEKLGDKMSLMYKKGNTWLGYTWREVGENIRFCSMALLEQGLNINDTAAIYSPNRPEWSIADYSIMSIRGITVTVYATDTASELEYILKDSEAKILFLDGKFQYDNVLSIIDKCPMLRKIVVFDDSVNIGLNDKIIYLKDFLDTGKNSAQKDLLDKRLEEGDSADTASIIYTSGTTGEPKGVMLTHANIYSQFDALNPRFNLGSNDIELCFLPLSHAYQKTSTHWMHYLGVTVYYCDSPDKVMEYFKEARPTYMVGVPRLYEKMYSTVYSKLGKASFFKRLMFSWAVKTGRKYQYRLYGKKFISPFLQIKNKIAFALVLKKIREIMGGRLNFFSAGGGPLSKEIEEFFFAAGIFIAQGYGLTETSPVVTCNYAGRFKFGSPGTVVDTAEVKIADDGEILIRGPVLMKGYFKKPEHTRDVMTADGWFKSGDIGFLDEEGFLFITDRKKDIIVTSGGKNVAPQKIESMLGKDYYIEQIAVIGDSRKYLTALIVPAFAPLEEYAAEKGIKFNSRNDLVSNKEIKNFYIEKINAASETLARFEKIQNITLLEKEFSQDAGEITPTMKIKRKNINANYKNMIDAMYSETS